jgi:hypothetical protein
MHLEIQSPCQSVFLTESWLFQFINRVDSGTHVSGLLHLYFFHCHLLL